MIKIKNPTIKEFPLKESETGLLEIASPEETREGYITFRQARTREVEIRTGQIGKRTWVGNDDGVGLAMKDETNWDFIARLEVFLTLEGTDITFPDGTALEFIKDNGVSSVKNRATFDKWWEQLDPKWARFIHARCQEVNPDFDPKS